MISDPPAVVIECPFAAELAVVKERLGSDAWQKIEALESVLERLPQEFVAQNHIFTPGLYLREVFIPAGTLLTTRIHLVEHPFIISAGVVSVWDNEWETLRAPHSGVTKPGTRRILYAHTDVIWSTIHATDKTDPDEVVREVTYSGGKFEQLGGAAATPALTAKGSQ